MPAGVKALVISLKIFFSPYSLPPSMYADNIGAKLGWALTTNGQEKGSA
jgi:hypothetical protein